MHCWWRVFIESVGKPLRAKQNARDEILLWQQQNGYWRRNRFGCPGCWLFGLGYAHSKRLLLKNGKVNSIETSQKQIPQIYLKNEVPTKRALFEN